MGYTQQKKIRKNKISKNKRSDILKRVWQKKRPVLFFIGGFCILMVLFYIVFPTSFYKNNIHPFVVLVYAKISGFILNLAGQNTQVRGDEIISARFMINLKKGCDAVEAMAVYASALLAFPAKWKKKIKGLLIGLAVLFVLNIIRVVSLFLAGVYAPKFFDLMHVEVWQVLFILIAVVMWIGWARKAIKNDE
jgi:exosortase/archaeosortase family protein